MKKIQILLIMCFGLNSCYDINEDYNSLDRDLLPKVYLSPDEGGISNGKDSINIRVTFPDNLNRDLAKVTFTISEGAFYENNAKEYTSSLLTRDLDNGDRFIDANIKTTTNKGQYILTVEVPDIYRRVTMVNFLPSFPNRIKVSKSKFAVSRSFNDEIQLIAQLSAEVGLPHKGTKVEFIVADSLSSSNSNLFRSLTPTDENGRASVLFTPGYFGEYTGSVSFKAFSITKQKDTIFAHGNIEIVEAE